MCKICEKQGIGKFFCCSILGTHILQNLIIKMKLPPYRGTAVLGGKTCTSQPLYWALVAKILEESFA